MNWEYNRLYWSYSERKWKSTGTDGLNIIEGLDVYGAKGWELVATSGSDSGEIFYLKRPLSK